MMGKVRCIAYGAAYAMVGFDCTESKRCKANFLQEFSQNT